MVSLAVKGVPRAIERVEFFGRYDDPGRTGPASYSLCTVGPVVVARVMHCTRVSRRVSGRRA